MFIERVVNPLNLIYKMLDLFGFVTSKPTEKFVQIVQLFVTGTELIIHLELTNNFFTVRPLNLT